MTTISTVASASRTVSVKAIDYRIDSGIRDLEYQISVGEQTITTSHDELKNIAIIGLSYLKPSEVFMTTDVAKELQPYLEKIIKDEERTQKLLGKYGKQ